MIILISVIHVMGPCYLRVSLVCSLLVIIYFESKYSKIHYKKCINTYECISYYIQITVFCNIFKYIIRSVVLISLFESGEQIKVSNTYFMIWIYVLSMNKENASVCPVSTVVTICTLALTLRNSAFYLQNVYMCFTVFTINFMVFVMMM